MGHTPWGSSPGPPASECYPFSSRTFAHDLVVSPICQSPDSLRCLGQGCRDLVRRPIGTWRRAGAWPGEDTHLERRPGVRPEAVEGRGKGRLQRGTAQVLATLGDA